jgi:myo-inositol-1(or 4)-monophosphatase
MFGYFIHGNIHMHPHLNTAIAAARQAGEIILRSSELVHRLKVNAKGNGDCCSEVDVKAEQVIINAIHKAYPQHGFIAEESGVFEDNREHVWIIDPLDGTKNYLHGFPFYAVSIALAYKGKIEHGVVYDPLRHECFSASRGQGAKLNDRRIRVSNASQLNLAMLTSGMHISNEVTAAKSVDLYKQFIGKCGSLRNTGSAALDLAYVAAGRTDGSCTLSLQTWDIAAGVLLVQEAGGFVSDFDGHDDYLTNGNVVAGTPKIFKQILNVINGPRQIADDKN